MWYTIKKGRNNVLHKFWSARLMYPTAVTLLNWIRNNGKKANPDKFHLLLSDKDENHSMQVGKYEIKNSSHKKLVGLTIDNKLTFGEHVSDLCQKASCKLNVLARVSTYMSLDQRKEVQSAFILS